MDGWLIDDRENLTIGERLKKMKSMTDAEFEEYVKKEKEKKEKHPTKETSVQ